MTNTPDPGQSAYPPPPPIDQAPSAPNPPREILGAFWGYVIAAVAGLVSGLLILGSKQEIADALRNANTQGTRLTETQIDQAATITMIIALVISVVFALLYLLFAFKLKAGRNWARIVLTIIAVLALISLVAGSGGTIAGYIGEVAAVVAAVLSYLPNSNAYIAAAKAAR
jgi:hypothetical protein